MFKLILKLSEATSSSFHSERYLPKFAIDGKVSTTKFDFFHSSSESHPWLQLEYNKPIEVEKVSVAIRGDHVGERFKNIRINVGDNPETVGQLSTNPLCALFVGPSSTGAVEEIVCVQPLIGIYVTVQRQELDNLPLEVNEITVTGTSVFISNPSS